MLAQKLIIVVIVLIAVYAIYAVIKQATTQQPTTTRREEAAQRATKEAEDLAREKELAKTQLEAEKKAARLKRDIEHLDQQRTED